MQTNADTLKKSSNRLISMKPGKIVFLSTCAQLSLGHQRAIRILTVTVRKILKLYLLRISCQAVDLQKVKSVFIENYWPNVSKN